MLPVLAVCLLLQSDQPIERDEYGVPHIKAANSDQAFYWAGYACAEDRMWQMEQSRRVARGRMAEVFGPRFAASDTDVLKTGYTDEELHAQYAELKPELRAAIDAYARGVNDFIGKGNLPPEFPHAGFRPAPWAVEDSIAIGVLLFDQFGRGGAGEIRNMALLGYLQGRAETKNRVLDVLDDFAWQNDAAATPTIMPSDEPEKRATPMIANFNRADTIKHIAMLPKVGLFELLPGLRLSTNEETRLVAEQVSAPFKMGSYAVVVGGHRSRTGAPLLLSAPQMGFRTPSIVHEMSIDAPGLSIVGIDVPGMPGIAIGKTANLAWGLTSGVADTDDIYFSRPDGADGYWFGDQRLKLQAITRTLHIKGAADQIVTQTRTRFGPVIIASKSAIFSRRSSYWEHECLSMQTLFDLYRATTPTQIDAAIAESPMSFNCFWATRDHIGYRYAGWVPMRAWGLDPRFPTPAEPKYDWEGMVPAAQMPHVVDPATGILANWNNKPVSWWPNLDTPVWGRIFRNSALLAQLGKPLLDEQDLEMAAWQIARVDPDWQYFRAFVEPVVADFQKRRFFRDPGPITEAIQALRTFDGRLTTGSYGARVFLAFIQALQEELFLPTTGNFVSMDNFYQVAQPTVVWNALNRRTKVDYLGKRTAAQVVEAAIGKAAERIAAKDGRDLNAWRYMAPAIKFGDEPPVPYSNRGTMIQVIDLSTMSGRNVVPPGVAESGPHSMDQVPLTRAWVLKPMRNRP